MSALSHEMMGFGPVEASRRALGLAGLTIDDIFIDLVEFNEAFAAQVLPSAREFGIDHNRLNVHGGAVAVGHPFGSTGARLTTTLLHRRRTARGGWGSSPCASAGAGDRDGAGGWAEPGPGH